MSRKKSLQDMLDAELGDITGAQEATRSIVNRQVVAPPAAPPVVEPPPASSDASSVQPGKEGTEIQKENETETQDVNLKVYQNLNPEKPMVLLEVEKPLKFHDTHKNESFLVRRDIMAKVNALCKKGGKGFKTRFVNEALQAHLLRYGIELPE